VLLVGVDVLFIALGCGWVNLWGLY